MLAVLPARLSDFLFAAARFSAQHDEKEEIIWRK